MRVISLNLWEFSEILFFARTVINYLRRDPKLRAVKAFRIVLRSSGGAIQVKYSGIAANDERFETGFITEIKIPDGASVIDFGSTVGLLVDMARPQSDIEYLGTRRDDGDTVISFGQRDRKLDVSNCLLR